MRVSFDLDGVFADMDTALARIAEEEFGVTARQDAGQEPARPGQARHDYEAGHAPHPGLGVSAAILSKLGARQQTRLWQRVQQTRNFWETLDEHEPGALRRLHQLATDLRWDVLFVTQRPSSEGRTVQVQSQRWLHKHGFQIPSVFTTLGSRGHIADALTLDAHVDDRLDHCVDVASVSKALPILVWRDAASFERIAANAKKLKITTVRTVNEAMDRLEKSSQSHRKGSAADGASSIVSRLKRAFGSDAR